MPIDVSRRPKGFNSPEKKLDFDKTAELLRSQALAVCQHLVPHGRTEGAEWRAGDLWGDPKGQSLGINTKTGVWKDFASGEGGADLIALWAKVRGLRMGQAKVEADKWLGINNDVEPAPRVYPASAVKLTEPSSGQRANLGGQKADHVWEYRNADGSPFGSVYRWDARDGRQKIVRPWDGRQWKAPEGQRPLLYLPEVLAGSDPVIIVEGEKKCDRLRRLGYNATSLWGGAQAIGRTDWSSLAGRSVVIWRDNDEPGAKFERELTDILQVVAASVATCKIPAGKPAKWDADDATDDECRAILDGVKPAKRLALVPTRSVTEWGGELIEGDPEPVQWLVDGVFPIGGASLLAAEGGTGKGMLSLDLALKVAQPDPGSINLNPDDHVLGRPVRSHGVAVVITAEDTARSVRARLASLDPTKEKRKRSRGRLLIQSLLSTPGGVQQLFVSTSAGLIEPTEEWERVCDDLADIENLRLVVFDPLSMFAPAGINVDPVIGQQVMNSFSRLADALECSVIVAHHMGKGSRDKPVTSPEEARHAIRGSGALVDGVRLAYALWPATEREARDACKQLGIQWQRQLIVRGGVVKANDPNADMQLRTFMRHKATGYLEDKTAALGKEWFSEEEKLDRLEREVLWAVEQRMPFTKGELETLADRPVGVLHRMFSKEACSKNEMSRLLDMLIAAGRLAAMRYNNGKKGGKTSLDRPGGYYDLANDGAVVPVFKNGGKRKPVPDDFDPFTKDDEQKDDEQKDQPE